MEVNCFVLRQSLLLLIAATIWGVAFVAQSVGMDYVEPFTFNAVRNVIGAVVLLPFICLPKRWKEKENNKKNYEDKKTLVIGGISCGILLFIASNLQQFGIQYTTVGKAGFITAMYIVIVPVLGIFLHKKVGIRIWFAVVVAFVGMYLLCMKDGLMEIQTGDLFVFGSALVFSLHILAVDYFSPKVEGVKLSCMQFFVCAVLSAVCMLFMEEPKVSQILSAWQPILYAGVMSCGVAYTLQIVGQKGINPTVASLILSLESVVSLLAGWIILGQKLSNRECVGCILAFGAIVLVQLPEKEVKKRTIT